MVGRDTEEVILGAWLLGEHLEDMKLFDPNDFEHLHTIAKNYMGGVTDHLDLANASGIKRTAIGDLMRGYENSFYESAMERVSQEKAQKWVYEHPKAKPQEIAEAMKMFERVHETAPSPSSNPVMELQEEFDRRRTTPIVSTGIRELDYLLNGIRRKELTSIGARPSVGKSAFCQDVAMKVARQGYRVLFFALEMSSEAVTERMFMRYVDFSQYSVRTGLTDEQWKDPQTAEAFDNIYRYCGDGDGNFLIFERKNDLVEIRQAIRKYKPYMIVIDQLEQLKDGKHSWQDKRSRFSHMTHELQGIAMDEDVAVWLACQVNRSADDAPPTMANLKESGSIEEDSDNVILLHRENDDNPEKQIIRLELAKQRGGACGVTKVGFLSKKFSFYGLETI